MAFTTTERFRKAKENGLQSCTAWPVQDSTLIGKFEKWDKYSIINKANWMFHMKFETKFQILEHFDNLITQRQAIQTPNHKIIRYLHAEFQLHQIILTFCTNEVLSKKEQNCKFETLRFRSLVCG